MHTRGVAEQGGTVLVPSEAVKFLEAQLFSEASYFEPFVHSAKSTKTFTRRE